MEQFTYGDYFSGISCPAFALKQLGISFSYKFACDNNKQCRQFLENNHKPERIYDDVKTITSLPHVDLFIAGFCCQPFSPINTTIKTEDHRDKDLYKYAIDGVLKSTPNMFIFENVNGLLTKPKKPYWDAIRADMRRLLGDMYIMRWKLINSNEYGTPQSRPRVYIIGKLKDATTEVSISWPEQVPLTTTLSDVLDTSIPITLPFTSKAIIGHPSSHSLEKNELYISNGQGTGHFARYRMLRKTAFSYCVCTRNVAKLYIKRDTGEIYYRDFTSKEIQSLFGLVTPIVGNYSVGTLTHFLGNGMDIHFLEQLLRLNCFPLLGADTRYNSNLFVSVSIHSHASSNVANISFL